MHEVRRLIGVGVGPGDPELITVKALRALDSADAILVPATEASGSGAGRAESIMVAANPELAGRIVRVPFSMADATGVTARRAEAWRASADAAVRAFEAGASTVCFATIGDPSVYSTFSYLAASVTQRLDGVEVSVVPGITAMQALAAASRTPLVEGDEVLALVPLKSPERLDAVLDAVDTCVVYKAGRHFAALKERLDARGGTAVAGIDVGLPGERIAPVDEIEEAPYMCSVISTPARTTIGGRL